MATAIERAQFGKETSEDGAWVRQRSAFREWVTADGSSDYPAQAGRYHLYVSYACGWAHRAIIVRALKGLEEAVGMTVVDPLRDERGWRFTYEPDPVNGFQFLAEAYAATDPSFDGRVTTPTLWDTQTNKVLNNESSDVIVMLNSEFDEFARNPGLDLYPAELRDEIDAINQEIYDSVNDGVYKCGFAATQRAYDQAVVPLFEMLDRIDRRLSSQRYLCGDRITLADWRLFTTLMRFDSVYYTHFKCNIRRIVDYPNLWGYTRDLYQVPGVAATVNMDHIKRHYFMTHDALNPSGIVPRGPLLNFDEPHGRDRSY